jgi:hypothetical protein
VACHVRVVQRVLSRAGAERAAHFALEFDPANDLLEIHWVRVWRGSECTEQARRDAFQILRRETQLERLALNGRLTATILVHDLRVDDRLEIACTLSSANTVLGGRYSGWMLFNGYAPSVETRQRIIRPRSRALQSKAFNDPPQALVAVDGEIEDSRWSIRGQQRLPIEELSPTWTVKNPCYEHTEFERWSEVADLFEPHYRDSSLPVDVARELDRLVAACSSQAEQAVEWLRFVQRELRYFALSLGEGGLIPRLLDEIWSTRFGDCKDAARLYVAGARRLGIDACAALVSTTHGLSLADFLPAPHVFNHVMVRLRLGGTVYWVDPTMQQQRGSLGEIALLHAGWALPLVANAELEQLPRAQPLHHVHCEDAIRFGPRPESPATLRRSMQFAYWTADTLRNHIESEGLSKLSTRQLAELRAVWRHVSETEPMSVRDDAVNNRLEVLCSYEIRDCWTREPDGKLSFKIADDFTVKELAVLKDTRRQSDILLGRPRKASWRAQLHMPRRWRGTGWSDVLDEPGIRFSSELLVEKDLLSLGKVLTIDTWSVTAARAEGYAEVASRVMRNLTTLWARERFGKLIPPVSGLRALARRSVQPLAYAVWVLCVVGVLVECNHWSADPLAAGSLVYPTTAPRVVDHPGLTVYDSDPPLGYCVRNASNEIGLYFESSCSEMVRLKVAYSTLEDPEEVILAPGAKHYVRFRRLSAPALVVGFAACPFPDQIVGSVGGEPWTGRDSSFTYRRPP